MTDKEPDLVAHSQPIDFAEETNDACCYGYLQYYKLA